MGVHDTLIPGAPPHVGPQRSGPIGVVVEPSAGQTADPYVAGFLALASAVRAGKGGAVMAGILAGVVSSSALWGLHDAVGGQEESRRMDALEQRLDKLEQQQKWERWALTSIARKVGAELPPKDDDNP